MATKSDYEQREIEAAKSVLIELMQILGEYREQMVLIGGWVPFFLFGETHVGSTDIDIALDREQITDDAYNTIREHLEKRGYTQGKQPFIFTKDVIIDEGSPVTIEIDFLSGEYGGTEKSHRHQIVQGDLKARKVRGCELAFAYHTKVTIEGKLPNGAPNNVQTNLSDVVPFIIMKGMALYDRFKEKDAWDIYFCVNHHKGGIDGLANEFDHLIGNNLVQEGLGKIRLKFDSVDGFGPTCVADFDEITDRDERERIKRDAYEKINALLDILKVAKFTG